MPALAMEALVAVTELDILVVEARVRVGAPLVEVVEAINNAFVVPPFFRMEHLLGLD
jgi:hypothetical protein